MTATTTNTFVVTLPIAFADDHLSRCGFISPESEITKRSAKEMTLALTALDIAEVLDDATHYASSASDYGPGFFGLCSSARATVKRIQRQFSRAQIAEFFAEYAAFNRAQRIVIDAELAEPTTNHQPMKEATMTTKTKTTKPDAAPFITHVSAPFLTTHFDQEYEVTAKKEYQHKSQRDAFATISSWGSGTAKVILSDAAITRLAEAATEITATGTPGERASARSVLKALAKQHPSLVSMPEPPAKAEQPAEAAPEPKPAKKPATKKPAAKRDRSTRAVAELLP